VTDRLTPDGVRYLALGGHQKVSRPFHFRWLLPRLIGQDEDRWRIPAYASAIVYLALLWAYTGSWWACLLGLGLSGVIHYNVQHPVLVDLPAMTLALGAATAATHGLLWLAVVLVLIAGCVKETAPPFAAVYAWQPILLVGLAPVFFRACLKAGRDPLASNPEHAEILAHPFRSAVEYHRKDPLWIYVLPWGVCVLGIANGSTRLWVALALAYGQLLVATDSVRLFQWAAPVLILATVPMLGVWLPVLLVLHLVNPFRSDGA
jgi:hypothetical protein